MSDSGGEVQSRRDRKKRKKLKVSMEVLSETADRIAPVVGYFPSGYNPTDPDEDPEVRVFRSKARASRMDLVVRPKDANVEFVGKSYAGEAAGAQMCTYALGVLDKETKTLKIVPIATNKILRLEPRVIKKSSESTDLSEGLGEEDMTAEKTERRIADLTSIYGTKKDKNRDSKLRTLREQRNGPSARELLESRSLDAELNNAALEDAKRPIVHNIPPHDASADTPEKVYLLDKILPKGDRDHLFDILVILQSGIAPHAMFWKENYYPSFVINRIYKLTEIQDEEGKNRFANILSYLTHLINFWKLASSLRRTTLHSYSDGRDKFKIPHTVFQKFMRIFVDPVSNKLSSERKELLIGYILVLTLFADGFQTNTTDIENDLALTYSNLKPYFLQLGCKSVQSSHFQKSLMALTVPLQLPDTMQQPRRRRQKK